MFGMHGWGPGRGVWVYINSCSSPGHPRRPESTLGISGDCMRPRCSSRRSSIFGFSLVSMWRCEVLILTSDVHARTCRVA